MSFKDIALPLAARGIHVIPINPFAKDCYLKGGIERGTLDPEQILAWDKANPLSNVGCLGHPQGVCILDCDVPGLKTQIEKETGHKFPEPMVGKSAGRGCAHYYFRSTDVSRRLGNKKGDGVFELRAFNQYVAGPGSQLRLPDGTLRQYTIWCAAPIADFPAWLEGWILKNSRGTKGGATGEVDTDSYSRISKKYLENLNPEQMFGLPDLTITSLHPTLHSLGCLLHDGPRTAEEVEELLERIAEEYGHRETRGGSEIEDIVRQVFQKEACHFTLPEGHPDIQPAFSEGLHLFESQEKWDYYKKTTPRPWEVLFHTKGYLEHMPQAKFAIEGFLQENGVTILGGLSGHGKTLVALAMVRSLLDGSPLFGQFAVPRLSDRVVYLIPESGPSPWVHRLRLFHLMEYVGTKFFTQTFAIEAASQGRAMLLLFLQQSDALLASRDGGGEGVVELDNVWVAAAVKDVHLPVCADGVGPVTENTLHCLDGDALWWGLSVAVTHAITHLPIRSGADEAIDPVLPRWAAADDGSIGQNSDWPPRQLRRKRTAKGTGGRRGLILG